MEFVNRNNPLLITSVSELNCSQKEEFMSWGITVHRISSPSSSPLRKEGEVYSIYCHVCDQFQDREFMGLPLAVTCEYIQLTILYSVTALFVNQTPYWLSYFEHNPCSTKDKAVQIRLPLWNTQRQRTYMPSPWSFRHLAITSCHAGSDPIFFAFAILSGILSSRQTQHPLTSTRTGLTFISNATSPNPSPFFLLFVFLTHLYTRFLNRCITCLYIICLSHRERNLDESRVLATFPTTPHSCLGENLAMHRCPTALVEWMNHCKIWNEPEWALNPRSETTGKTLSHCKPYFSH